MSTRPSPARPARSGGAGIRRAVHCLKLAANFEDWPSARETSMKVINAIAKILKSEGIEWLIGYPVNPIIEGAAEENIRTIMVRQERIGLHMCDAVAKTTSGDKIGVFVMQHGPGTENAFGGGAQSYGDATPGGVLRAGYARNINQVHPNFSATLNFRHVTKSSEQVTVADATV